MYSQLSSSAFIAALNPVVSSCGLLSWIKLSGSKKYHHFRTPFSLPKSTCLIYRFRIAPLNNQYEKKKKEQEVVRYSPNPTKGDKKYEYKK